VESLDDLERAVLEMLVAGDAPSTRRLQEQLAACRVGARDRTGVGFFTTLKMDRTAVGPIEVGSARVGDVVAEIEGLRDGAGFLLTIADGYLDELEGYSYDEPWPEEIVSFTLSYTEEPRDLTALTPPSSSAPAVHEDAGDVVAGDPQERREGPHEG
jgi:hypothetical protein